MQEKNRTVERITKCDKNVALYYIFTFDLVAEFKKWLRINQMSRQCLYAYPLKAVQKKLIHLSTESYTKSLQAWRGKVELRSHSRVSQLSPATAQRGPSISSCCKVGF